MSRLGENIDSHAVPGAKGPSEAPAPTAGVALTVGTGDTPSMRGIKTGWLAALIVACGLGAPTASAESPSFSPPARFLAGSAVALGGAEAIRVQLRASQANATLANRRDALRACVRERANCIGITDLDSFNSEDTFGLTPKIIQACVEKTDGKVIPSFGEKPRKSQIAETDLRELLRKCHPGAV